MFPQSLAAAVSLGLVVFGSSLDASVPATPQTQPPAPLTITVKARSIRPGELALLTVRSRGSIDAVHARAFDRDLPASAVNTHTWRVLVAIDLDTALRTYPIDIEVTTASGVLHATHPLVVVARTFRTRRLTVDPNFVNPPADVLDRIAREAAELNGLWSHGVATKLWTGPFVRPVPDEANSAFGTRSILNGEARSPHSGADFDSPAGTPIKSPNTGRVVLAGDRYYTGNTVMIDHGLSVFSLFAHLSEIQVQVGDMVAPGQVIGKVGATGRVTGPHLHWSVRINGARVDPLSLLSVLGPQTSG